MPKRKISSHLYVDEKRTDTCGKHFLVFKIHNAAALTQNVHERERNGMVA